MRTFLWIIGAIALAGCARDPDRPEPKAAAVQAPGVAEPVAKVEPDKPGPIAQALPLKAEPKDAAIPVKLLWSIYWDNEIDADLKYLGKFVELTDNVGEVGKEKGVYFAGLVTASGGRGIFYDIRCYLRDGQAKKFASIDTKDGWLRCKIQGTCQGKENAAGTWKGWRVVLKDCVMIGEPFDGRNK